jgi:hypothetical protein
MHWIHIVVCSLALLGSAALAQTPGKAEAPRT